MARQPDRPRPQRGPASLRVALDFIWRINRADVDGLTGLMTVDHLLIDSLGQRLRGRSKARRAWVDYFQMVPDYRVVVRQVLTDGNTVVAIGEACGRCVTVPGGVPLGRWRTPAAWRAVVSGDRVARWQVFADNEPMRALMRVAR